MHNQEVLLKTLDNMTISDWEAGCFLHTSLSSDVVITYTVITN